MYELDIPIEKSYEMTKHEINSSLDENKLNSSSLKQNFKRESLLNQLNRLRIKAQKILSRKLSNFEKKLRGSSSLSTKKSMIYKIEELKKELALKDERIRELEKFSSIDGLTGLYNRAHFDKRFIEEMDRAKRYKEPLSLIMIDADKFKDINDNYGHDIGDKALRNIANAINSGSLEVAKLLEKASRKSDICFRFGGDEFCIVLPNTNKEQANIVASRIQSSLSKEKIKLGEKTISINISIGTETFYPDQMKNVTSDELFKAADKRMYEQKYKNK